MSTMSGSRRGFTLVEVLVAMTIVLILTALLAMGLGGSKDKAAHKASKALVSKIKVALESYNAEFRDYPPDGYDLDDPGWNVTAAQGVAVRPPDLLDSSGSATTAYKLRRVKGTSALIYFLCRPQIKRTRMSSDPGDKTMNEKRLEPFLQLDTRDYTRPKITAAGEEITFEPNHPWGNDAYWDRNAGGGILTEIIDAYGRPLCYDKVRTALTVSNVSAGEIAYFNPGLFQSGSGVSTGGVGIAAHPDAAEYILGGLMPINADQEPSGFADADENTLLTSRMDPRLRSDQIQTAINALEGGASTVPAGDVSTHEPKNVPGYNVWSAGRSWIDFRDDIVSWAD